MEPFIVVRIKGKQYLAKKGDRLVVDRLPNKEGSKISFNDVLLSSSGSNVSVGTPLLKGAKLDAKVIAHPRGPKGMAFRYKPKKGVRVHRGFRADLTELEVIGIKV